MTSSGAWLGSLVAQNHAILLCPYRHLSSAAPWCPPRREPQPQHPARPWKRGRAHQLRGVELVQRPRRQEAGRACWIPSRELYTFSDVH